ncbi:hypothetical protein CIK05_02570 [Bdellovibrio sp. qaytius]|nr:hypothetical protein CIK05_02570 [Bdellovibrio sp. qaytius]
MNKYFIALLLSFCATSVFAQSNCMNSCSQECIKAAQQILVNCSGVTPAPTPSAKTALYHSDSCNDSDLIANLKPGTDCSSQVMTSAQRTWGIKVRGTCYDVSDLETPLACVKFKAASNASATLFYHSDSCQTSELIAAVDESTDCDALSKVVTDRVWGVVTDGQCVDISDADMKAACVRYKDAFVTEKK